MKSFVRAGAQYIHIVDLDGAKDGKRVNGELILSLCKESPVPVEVGGGIRNTETIEYYLSCGVKRVILGSAAVKDPDFAREAVKKYKDAISIGIDAKDGFVSVSGWTENTRENYIDFAKKMESFGVKNIIFTDISKDGTLDGPNLAQLCELKKNVSIDITASGGIKDEKDIRNLKEIGVYGAICGRSLYDGTLDLTTAVKICAEED